MPKGKHGIMTTPNMDTMVPIKKTPTGNVETGGEPGYKKQVGIRKDLQTVDRDNRAGHSKKPGKLY